MNARAVLSSAGLALLAGGAVLVAFAFVRPGEPRATPPAQTETIGVALYAQNHHFNAAPSARMERTTLRLHAAPKWVERGALLTDREPRACRRDGRDLHVFTLATRTGTLYALGFIADTRSKDIACMLAVRERTRIIDHPPSFAAADALLRRGKLEFVAHPELRDLPQAQYPSHDKPLLPVSFTK
ncbi:MAG: hypothetical protein NVSMB5_05110 [Candidatus Velthaea sp.]